MIDKLTDADQHALQLGQVMGNLHSLEVLLRAFLYRMEIMEDRSKTTQAEIYKLEVGNSVIENSMTNYDTLGQVILKYNEIVSKIDSSLQVDPEIAELRDGIAHGRVLAKQPERPLRLFKFSRPRQGKVTVTHVKKKREMGSALEKGQI
jgi:hypothetical protein